MSKVQHTPFTLGRHTSFDILTNGVARFVVTDTHTHTQTPQLTTVILVTHAPRINYAHVH